MKANKSIYAIAVFMFPGIAWGLDSYRFLHVTIETPWAIFMFLLPIVLSPFIIMAILYWRYAGKKPGQGNGKDEG